MGKMETDILIKAAELMVSLLVLWGILYWGRDRERTDRLIHAYHDLAEFLRDKSRNCSPYRKRMMWLKKNGASFHYGGWVEPVRFLLLELVLGLLGLVLGSQLDGFAGVLGFVLLFFMPSVCLVMMNKKDNERMLSEIKLVYHALEIQTRAGVYITDALAECYGSVSEKRLKSALLELAGDIVLQADIESSLEKLQSKFDNVYVDSLCLTILQALESGQAVELLREIGEQIKDMEHVVLERRKTALDRKVTFCQLGMLAVMLGIALYACITSIFGTITKV